MTLSIWNDDPASELRDEEVDVAIIGGGIMGAACAYWLSRRSKLKVVLLEAAQLASGASGRNAGFVLRGIQAYYNQAVKTYGRSAAKNLFHFGEDSLHLLKEFADKHGPSFEYNPCGSYLLADSQQELSDLHESMQLMREDGLAAEYFDSDPLERGYQGALLNPDDAGVHPARLVKALADNSKVRVLENEPVAGMEAASGETTIIQTNKRRLKCSRVLLTVNAHALSMDDYFQGKVKPARAQAFVTKPLNKRIVDKLCYANYGWEYFRQLPDGRFLLGGCRELHFEQEATFADMVTPGLQKSLEQYLQKHFPELSDLPIDHRWSGTMGFSPDGLPLLGRLPQLPGVYFSTACNGHGMGYGFALSQLLTQVALDGQSAGMFAAERFNSEVGSVLVGATKS